MREEENAVPEGQRKMSIAGLSWRKAPIVRRPEKAPVILLHGFAQTPASWDGVARILQRQGRRTYAPNLFAPESGPVLRACDCEEELTAPGDAAYDRAGGPTSDLAADPARGVADSPTGDPINHPVADPLASLGAVCDRVAAIVRLVAAAEGAPVLVGYSMGGRIAAETMVRHPGLPLAGLVLESAGLGPADDAARAALARRNGEWAARLREGGVAAFMDWWETLPLFATSGSCPRPPALPSASVARPTTQKPSLVPWRLGVRTIRRRKARLRLLSPKCEWPVVQFSIWRGLATRNTLPSPPAFALPVFLPSSWKVPVTMFTWKSPRYSQGPLRSLQGHPLRALCPRSARRWRDWSCFLAWNSRPWSQNGAKGRTL